MGSNSPKNSKASQPNSRNIEQFDPTTEQCRMEEFSLTTTSEHLHERQELLPPFYHRDLKVELLPIGAILPYAHNPRTHSRKQIRQLVRSIQEFGFTNPVLIGVDGKLIAGHGRLLAAQLVGMENIPCIRLDQM